jgi:hypothetical protein
MGGFHGFQMDIVHGFHVEWSIFHGFHMEWVNSLDSIWNPWNPPIPYAIHGLSTIPYGIHGLSTHLESMEARWYSQYLLRHTYLGYVDIILVITTGGNY